MVHGVPIYICEGCESKVNDMYEFKRQCIQNLNDLAAYYNQQDTLNTNLPQLSFIFDRNATKRSRLDRFRDDIDHGRKSQNEVEKSSAADDENVSNIKFEEVYINNNVQANIKQEKLDEDTHSEEYSQNNNKTEQEIINREEITSKSNSNPNICNFTISAISTSFAKKVFEKTPPVTTNCKMKNKELLKCNYCDKTFDKYSKLTIHKIVHTGGKFQCETCLKQFTLHVQLKRHNRIHTGEKPYQCDECQQSFRHQATLTNHKRVHSGDKPFKCGFCMKTFRQNGALKYHINTHIKVKQFKCEVCPEEFPQKCDLNTHMKSHEDSPFTLV